MDVRQQDVERIVVEVLKKMMSDQPTAAATTVVAASGCDCGDFGLFDRLEDAVQAAEAAQKKISTVAMRDKIIAAIRKAGLENAKAFAEIAHNETGMGRVSDKIAKNILVCERTPGTECLSPMAISGDMGLTLIENAPWGVIASVTPSTNPTATVINNAISMIAGGNSVIFAPHPNAKRASQTAIQVLNKAIIEATGVANLLVAVKEPTIEVAQELFSHPRIKLLVVTGGEAVVAQARKVATMRLIAAGAGNPPVVVDETANIARAARSIYDGASFDNNIICADEKEIIAVDSIADQLKAEMKVRGRDVVGILRGAVSGPAEIPDHISGCHDTALFQIRLIWVILTQMGVIVIPLFIEAPDPDPPSAVLVPSQRFHIPGLHRDHRCSHLTHHVVAQMFSLKPVGTGRAEIIEITVRKIFGDRRERLQAILREPYLIASGLLLEIPNHAV